MPSTAQERKNPASPIPVVLGKEAFDPLVADLFERADRFLERCRGESQKLSERSLQRVRPTFIAVGLSTMAEDAESALPRLRAYALAQRAVTENVRGRWQELDEGKTPRLSARAASEYIVFAARRYDACEGAEGGRRGWLINELASLVDSETGITAVNHLYVLYIEELVAWKRSLCRLQVG